jgi:hypothetical protein
MWAERRTLRRVARLSQRDANSSAVAYVTRMANVSFQVAGSDSSTCPHKRMSCIRMRVRTRARQPPTARPTDTDMEQVLSACLCSKEKCRKVWGVLGRMQGTGGTGTHETLKLMIHNAAGDFDEGLARVESQVALLHKARKPTCHRVVSTLRRMRIYSAQAPGHSLELL